MNEQELIDKFQSWGREKSKPKRVFLDIPSSDEEVEAKNYFEKTNWNEIDTSQLQKYWNVSIIFSPEAFDYFLPGIIISCILEKSFCLFHETLFSPLDTAYGIKYLSEPIYSLWRIIERERISVVIEFILWISEQKWFSALSDDSVLRISQTLYEIGADHISDDRKKE